MAIKPYAVNPSQRDTLEIPKNGSNSEVNNNISRIWNVFKSSIVLDELSIIATGDGTSKQKTEDSASLSYPLVKINDYIFSPDEIISMTINSTGFLPTIVLSVATLSKLFITKSMPKDGDIISIMIRNKNDILNPIRNDYVITGVPTNYIQPNDKMPTVLTFYGELFIPALKSYLSNISFTDTIMNTLKKVSEILSLGFNTNESDTNDFQTWISGDTIYSFITELSAKAWKDENSFFDSWIDVYYNLNFVNIQKILLSPEDEIDPAAFINNIDIEFTWGSNTSQENLVQIPKVLSNLEAYKTSSNYIHSWKPINKSSAITFEYGTSIECSFFEHLDALYLDPASQKYWELELSPAYDDEKINSHILLRGRPYWDPNLNQGKRAQANYSYKELYKKSTWLGIQYTLSNPEDSPDKWVGNHHSNYMRAQVHNLINNIELDKLNIDVKIRGINNNIIRGDKLPIVLFQADPVELLLANPEDNLRIGIDRFYTGWYYVKGFNLSWVTDREEISSFSQTFVLTRREWPPPENVESIKKEPNENNSNI